MTIFCDADELQSVVAVRQERVNSGCHHAAAEARAALLRDDG